MRTRTVIATLLLVAVAGACSRDADVPAADDARDNTVLPAGGDAGAPVVSPVETHVPQAAPAQPRDADRPAVRRPARPQLAADGPAAEASTAEPSEAVGLASPAVADAAANAGGPDAGANAAVGSGKPRPIASEGPIPDNYGRPGVILIRGGSPRADDDCAIHPILPEPGMGGGLVGIGGGALINDRSPPGGALVNDRGPATPSVGGDPVSRGGPVLNNPDPRRGGGIGGLGAPRGAARGGAMPRRGIR